MDIKTAKADLKKRQEAVVKGINEVIAQEQQLAVQKQGLIEEALRLNGEARMLNRLDGNNKKSQAP